MKKMLSQKEDAQKAEVQAQTPTLVHVWEGISKQGATQLMFSGIMNATKYGDILSASLVPFIADRLPTTHRLYQDNDPKHTSRYIQSFFADNKVNWCRDQ